MRHFLVLLAVITALGIVLAHDHGHGNGDTPDHPHMLVQRYQIDVVIIDGEPFVAVVGWRRCVDLAAGRNVPLNAHHDGLHTGRAGQALLENAGHWVIPGAPITPWANCAALQAALPIPLGPAE